MVSSAQILSWLTLVYGLAVPVIAVIYWRAYGPTNFLWLSDIGLVLTLAALLSGSRLLASMGAVGVLALELAWTIDFLAGGRFISIDSSRAAAHAPLVYEFGYDRRALIYQTLLTWAVLIVTYLTTDPAKNINWVFGPGSKPQHVVPLLYLGLEMAIIPICVFLPTHLLLDRFF
jgi:hypothetical protein